MGAIADLTNEEKVILSGEDSIVIRRLISSVIGGRTLDMTGFPDEYIKAGHPVIYEKSTDTWKPFPVSNGAFSTLPAGSEYKGVVIATKPAKRPFVGIMYAGEVNDEVMPYKLTDAMRTALKTALPQLVFTHD